MAIKSSPQEQGGGAGKTFSSVGKALQPAMLVYENPNGKLFESDYASCPLYCKLADAHLYISRPWSSGDQTVEDFSHGLLN